MLIIKIFSPNNVPRRNLLLLANFMPSRNKLLLDATVFYQSKILLEAFLMNISLENNPILIFVISGLMCCDWMIILIAIHEFYQPILIDIFSVVAMVGEIVHQIEGIIIAREAVLDPLVETEQVHHQIEMKGDHINALEKIVHFQEEKGELSWNLHPHILFLLRIYSKYYHQNVSW